MNREVPSFKVLNWDFNRDSLEEYDVMPYFLEEWEEEKNRKLKTWKLGAKSMPTDFEDIRRFIERRSSYQFEYRCEYEIVITGWPVQKKHIKIDVHSQVMMNLDTITKLLMNYIYGSEA